MRGLSGDERGGVLPLVAAFSVVVVAMAALVVDVGSLQDERRQLQNGADAAALGVAQLIAKTCPSGPCTPASLVTMAQGLADANADDDETAIDSVTPDYANQRVAVSTSTRERDGGTILPYWFGQAVTGSRGQTVRATAVATWAGLDRATVIPLTLSKCEFVDATANGTVFGQPTTIVFHGRADSCSAGPSGADLPAGFGWLKDENDGNASDCNVTPSVGDLVREDTGVVGTPHSCDLSTLLGTDILISLYDGLSGSGTTGEYHVYGFGMFHLTGFRFPSKTGGSPPPCSPPKTCIGGHFVKFVGIGDYGGPSVGNQIVLVS